MGLTENGYEKRSVDELKKDMVAALREMGTAYENQPADIQNNLLDSALVILLQFENLVAEMCNGYAPAYANDFLWLNLANSLGLTQKEEQQAQVDLQFTGSPGTYIPSGVNVGAFTTTQSLTLGTTGVGIVKAVADTDVSAPANTLTEIDEIIADDLKVTNPEASISKVPKESIEALRKRAQTILRTPRKGGYAYAIERLNSVEGVASRLVQIREIDFLVTEQGVEQNQTILRNIQGIEVVVGGGDPYEVAGVLKDAFLETQKLISRPSNDEADRTIDVEIKYYGNTIPIKFTRPKNLDLTIVMYANLQNRVIPLAAMKGALSHPIEEYINNLHLGEPINKLALTDFALNILRVKGVEPTDFKNIDFVVSQGVEVLSWNEDGFLDAINFDTYVTLAGFNVEYVS